MERLGLVVFTGALALSCTGVGDSSRIEVVEDNALGVVAIELEHMEASGDSIFELRGFDADGGEVAVIRRRIGTIADLSDVLDLGQIGSEIVFDVPGHEQRFITRAIDVHQLAPLTDPVLQELVELPVVASALDREANLVVAPRPTEGERGYYAAACDPGALVSPNTGEQCCGYTYIACAIPFCLAQSWTRHVNTSTAKSNAYDAVTRAYNNPGNGAACKSSTGFGSCSGKGCYFGPNGWAMQTVQPHYNPDGSWNYFRTELTTLDGQDMCTTGVYTTPQTPVFSNVKGTAAGGAGCCVNGSGPCDYPGKPACTACGGGGAAGRGSWDL